MKKILSILIFILGTSAVHAQIAYQISLLNTATGEPRANEIVNATITITNSSDETVYTTTQQATTNDFGVLSFAVGDANTFSNMDSGKFPLFISVTVNNVLIGKSQILNVPVAEYSKKLVSTFTKEGIVGTWGCGGGSYTYYYYIKQDGTYFYEVYNAGSISFNESGKYAIQGDAIYFLPLANSYTDKYGYFFGQLSHAIFNDGRLYTDDGIFLKQ